MEKQMERLCLIRNCVGHTMHLPNEAICRATLFYDAKKFAKGVTKVGRVIYTGGAAMFCSIVLISEIYSFCTPWPQLTGNQHVKLHVSARAWERFHDSKNLAATIAIEPAKFQELFSSRPEKEVAP